ncbi:MAG: hypothetical protein JWN24_4417 [Phycisphaerales bacterium]|nr:hypothetical protein [Phycisphaerales bacterium]
MQDLGTLGGNFSWANAVNNAGQIVGASTVQTQTPAGTQAIEHAFLWSDGKMVDLQPAGQGGSSEALGINDSGEIVGQMGAPLYVDSHHFGGTTTGSPFLYSDGVMYNLNDLIPHGNGVYLTSARAINNQGAIVGEFSAAGGYRGVYRLDPISLAPLELRAVGGAFTLDDTTQRYGYSGTVDIGLTPTGNATFQPLLEETNGLVSYDNQTITANGAFTSIVSTLHGPLFTGSFTIPVGTATTSQMDVVSGVQIADLTTDFSSLSFALGAGGTTSDSRLNLNGSFTLPQSLGGLVIQVGSAGPLGTTAPFVVGSNGFGLATGPINVPNINFTFSNLLQASAKSMSFQYTSATQELEVQGDLMVGIKSGTDLFNLDLNLTGDNFIDYQAGQPLKVVATLTYASESGLPVFSNWFSITGAQLSVNTVTNAISGSITLVAAGGKVFSGNIGFLNGQLDSIGLNGDQLAIPMDPPGLFLQSIGGSLDHLAPSDPAETVITGVLGLSYGVPKTFTLPLILGGGTFTGALVTASLTTTVRLNQAHQIDDISGDASVSVAAGIATGTAHFDANPEAGTFSLNASLQAVDNLFSFQGLLTASTAGALTGYGVGSVSLSIPFYKTITLTSVSILANLSPSADPSRSYFSAWGTLGIFGASTGIKIDLAGNVSLLNAVNLPTVPPPSPQLAPGVSAIVAQAATGAAPATTTTASQAFSVPASTAYILLAAAWANAASPVPFQIVAPDGTVYTNADVGNGVIAEVPSLSNSTTLTIAVQAPSAGTWQLILPNSDSLGSVQFAGFAPTPAASIQVTAPPTTVPGGSVEIDYTATDANANASVSLFYDTPGNGYQGMLIASGLPVGANHFIWNTGALSPGAYHLYAVVDDNIGIPYLAYAPGTISIIPPPTLTSTIIGDGTAQRSVFHGFTLNFDQVVNLAPGAVTMNRVTTNSAGVILTSTAVDPSAFTITNPLGDGKTWIVTVAAGGMLDGGRGDFRDGVYQFTVHSALVTNAYGSALAGGDQTKSFRKLFGDFNGDGRVSNADFTRFSNAFGSMIGDANFRVAFDYNHDGKISNADFAFFSNRFGVALYLPV